MKRIAAYGLVAVLVLVFGLSAAAAADRLHPRGPGQFLAGALGLAVAVVLVAVILAAFLVLVAFLFPGKVEAVGRTCRQSPGLTFLIGLVNAALAIGIAALLSRVKVLEPVAGLVLAVVAFGGIVGLAPSLSRLGGAVARMWGRESASDLARMLMGTACAALAACVVWVGWAFLGYLVLQGLGGVVLSCLRADRPPAAPEPS
jgi:hypothetical protein